MNEKAVEKIQICWNVTSRYLAEIPGGAIDGFLERYIAEERKILAEREFFEGESSGHQSTPQPSPGDRFIPHPPPPPPGNDEIPPPPPPGVGNFTLRCVVEVMVLSLSTSIFLRSYCRMRRNLSHKT